ncbi:MAG: efflux RND transporter periplasmic adaptor subunit [Chitinophagaceae bacterium]|nr:efflux RND transporter periplasmic adaptor subunit [Chitinophagaceae bacterium]
MKYIIGIAILLLAACGDTATQAPEKKQAAPANPVVVELSKEQMAAGQIATAKVETVLINGTVSLNGIIDVPPQHMVSITCPLGGYVRQIDLLPGQEVSKGQALVTLEDPAYIQLQQDYLVAKSKQQFLQQENERQRELAATEAASQKAYQQVQSELAVEQAMMQALEQKLALIGIHAQQLTAGNISRTIVIRSPIHGFISKVPINRGRYVTGTEVLAELIDPGDLHAALTVFEKDLNVVKAGQQVTVRPLNNPAQSYTAKVLLVSRNVDESKSGMVHCHFDKIPPALAPGFAVTASIATGRQQLPAVPESAILLSKGKSYVFVSEAPGRFRLTEVQPGERENGLVGITSNNIAWEGKEVVTKGAFSLLGMLLKSEEEE